MGAKRCRTEPGTNGQLWGHLLHCRKGEVTRCQSRLEMQTRLSTFPRHPCLPSMGGRHQLSS
eukprot:4307004-Pleurochrysis_carterae.AAC.1